MESHNGCENGELKPANEELSHRLPVARFESSSVTVPVGIPWVCQHRVRVVYRVMHMFRLNPPVSLLQEGYILGCWGAITG